jgi:hypothetical protein
MTHNIYYTSLRYILLLILILIVIAGFRPIGFDRDSIQYVIMLDTYTTFFTSEFFRAEPTFWLFEAFNQNYLDGTPRNIFIIYAILGVTLKLFAISRLSLYPILSIIAYICIYFPLHEMTQIRVGIASAIFLLAIPDIVDKRLDKYIFKILLAMLFHYSSIIMIFFYFINTKEINRFFYLLLPVLAIFISIGPFSMFNIFSYMVNYLPSFLSENLNRYIEIMEVLGMHNKINIFDLYHISLLLLYIILIMMVRYMKSKYDIVVTKLLGFSLFTFYIFSFLPVLATRISEYIGVVVVLAVTIPLRIYKQKIPSYILISIFLFLNLSTFLIIKDDFFDFTILNLYFEG